MSSTQTKSTWDSSGSQRDKQAVRLTAQTQRTLRRTLLEICRKDILRATMLSVTGTIARRSRALRLLHTSPPVKMPIQVGAVGVELTLSAFRFTWRRESGRFTSLRNNYPLPVLARRANCPREGPLFVAMTIIRAVDYVGFWPIPSAW